MPKLFHNEKELIRYIAGEFKKGRKMKNIARSLKISKKWVEEAVRKSL